MNLSIDSMEVCTEISEYMSTHKIQAATQNGKTLTGANNIHHKWMAVSKAEVR